MISSYADLMTQVFRFLNNEEAPPEDVPVLTMRQIIGLAERRIYREVRSRHNEKAFSAVTVTGNAATLPTDFEAVSIVHFGKDALEPVSEEWLRAYLKGQPTGECAVFAEAGGSLMFGPAVADGTTVQGRYFFRFPALSESTFSANTLLAKEEDLFLYGCLVEGAPFFGVGQDRLALWSSKYAAIADRLNTDKNRTATNAGRVVRRASSSLIG